MSGAGLSKRARRVKNGLRALADVVKETVAVYAEHEMPVYAGYTTLYILMAMVPLLTLVIGLVNMLPDVSLQHVETVLRKVLPDIPQVQSMTHTVIANVNRQAGSLAVPVSVLVSLRSASTGVNAIQLGLCKISGTGGSQFRQRAAALLYTLLFVALIPALLIFRVLRASIVDLIALVTGYLKMPDVAHLLMDFMEYSGLITLAAMGLVIVLAYTYLQGERKKLRDQIPGTVFAAVLWLLFSRLFEIFISRFWHASSLYGSLASILLAAMWLKSITAILFYGAALNEVLGRRRAGRA